MIYPPKKQYIITVYTSRVSPHRITSQGQLALLIIINKGLYQNSFQLPHINRFSLNFYSLKNNTIAQAMQ